MLKRKYLKKIRQLIACAAIFGLCAGMVPGNLIFAKNAEAAEMPGIENRGEQNMGSDREYGMVSEGDQVSGGNRMPAAASEGLNKDTWTQGEDGKWRKIVDVPGMDISSLATGAYQMPYKPAVPKPIHQFYDDGPGAGATAEVKESNGGKVLELAYSANPNNTLFKFDVSSLEPNLNFELNFNYTASPVPNVTISVQHNGSNIAGKSYNAEGTENYSVNPTFSQAGVSDRSGKLTFSRSAFTSNIADIKMWSGGKTTITIQKLELIAVSNTNPDEASDREMLIRSNDIITPKNAGNFENWVSGAGLQARSLLKEQASASDVSGGDVSGNDISGNSAYGNETGSGPDSEEEMLKAAQGLGISLLAAGADWGGVFTKTGNGNVSVTTEDKYKGNQSAKIEAGSEITLQLDNLKSGTEYSIFFAGRTDSAGAGNRLEFRLSGFRNNQKFDYDNGNYNNTAEKQWSEEEKANMFNWLENLSIMKDSWTTFRYDFTTGENQTNSVRARFTAAGAAAYVDEIYIVEKSSLKETSYTLPSNSELSRGSRILIDQGLQIMSWMTTDTWEKEKGWIKQPSLEQIQDMGLTAVQYNDKPNFSKALHDEAASKGVSLKWATAWGPKFNHISSQYQDSGDGKVGMPTEEEWENGYLTEEMGSGYIKDLVSMCIGDEEDYSDTLTQNTKSWFELIREHYDNANGRTTDILLHHNDVGNTPQDNLRQISTFNKNMLRKYVQTAKPDMITFDMYYFRERRLNQTKGGTVIPFYDDLNRYRIVSGEGLDGTGEQPIPFGIYTYSWRTGPGAASAFKRGDGWYELTESQLNLYTFATWAFGGKWLSNFRWLDDNPSYLFSDYKQNPDGTSQQYYIYDQFKEMIRQSKNLGPHLVRLNNEEVAIVRGSQIKDGQAVANNKPADNPDWSDIKSGELNQNVHIADIQVENLGTQNDGLNGDIFVSYFAQLPNLKAEDKNVFTCSDPRYFMLLNGLTSGDGLPAELQQGSSYETRQKVTVTFENVPAGAVLKKVSRVSGGRPGDAVAVPLVDGRLVTEIGGGYADLYFWEEGTPNAGTTTGIADESGRDSDSIGHVKYAKAFKTMDLKGREVVIGHIKGTDDMAPEASMSVNINAPDIQDQVDGKVINLSSYATSGANIGAIGTRYFKQDIWEMRLDAIEKNNNVKITFKEYDWTKEALLAKLRDRKNGADAGELPDLLVVPNEWLWSMDGLLNNHAVYAMESFQDANQEKIFDLDARKWNEAYEAMTSRDGWTYSSVAEPSMDVIGMFVNRTMLPQVGAESFNAAAQTGIYALQKQDKWTFAELEKIMDSAISNHIVSKGIKLFADNDYLVRELLASAGVTQNPYKFNAHSREYKEAVRLYTKLKDNGLLLEGTNEEHMKAFQDKKLIFLVAPYTAAAQKFAASYLYYEDNAIRETRDLGGIFGYQTFTSYKKADGDWQVTVRIRPDGEYVMGKDDWNFMLFPKADLNSNYKAILNAPSYPVLLKGVEKPEEIAFIWNELAKEYIGVNTVDGILKRGGVQYPGDRNFEGATGDKNAKDIDSLRKAGLRDAWGDNLAASGVWDNVLKEAIQTVPNDFEAINRQVAEYLSVNQPTDPIFDMTSSSEVIRDASAGLDAAKDKTREEKEKEAGKALDKIAALKLDKETVDRETVDELVKLEEKIRELLGAAELVPVVKGQGVPETNVNNAVFSVGINKQGTVNIELEEEWTAPDQRKLAEGAKAFQFTISSDEKRQQLLVPVLIKMAVPDSLDADDELLLLHYADGSNEGEAAEFTRSGSYIEFMARSFSIYVLANPAKDTEPAPSPAPTPDPGPVPDPSPAPVPSPDPAPEATPAPGNQGNKTEGTAGNKKSPKTYDNSVASNASEKNSASNGGRNQKAEENARKDQLTTGTAAGRSGSVLDILWIVLAVIIILAAGFEFYRKKSNRR